jgi:hypothetical protein
MFVNKRNRGTVFRYFAVEPGIRVNSIRLFRYLLDSRSRKAEAAPFPDHAVHALLYANDRNFFCEGTMTSGMSLLRQFAAPNPPDPEVWT